MTDESPYLRCLNCGWVRIGVARPQPAPDRCFRCKRFAFEVIDEAELLRTVPRGVTLQGLRWPSAVDLFGQWCFIREWGRIGRAGQVWTIPYPTAGEAHEALAVQQRVKERRGYASKALRVSSRRDY